MVPPVCVGGPEYGVTPVRRGFRRSVEWRAGRTGGVTVIGRLLPWSGPDGQPAYLMPGDAGSGSYLSRLADNLEATQLGMGQDLLAYVSDLMSHEPSEVELRSAVCTLSQALTDAIRVAESRGDRLPVSEDDALSHEAAAVVAREIKS